jgi:hypothetical protein
VAEARAVNAVSDGFNLQQEVRKTVQDALREYLSTPENVTAEVQSVQHASSRFSTADVWEVVRYHLGLLTGDPFASVVENQVTSVYIALKADFQQELVLIVLVVADKDTHEMNALPGSGSKETNLDMRLQFMVVVIFPVCLLICRSMEYQSPSWLTQDLRSLFCTTLFGTEIYL